MPGGGGKVDPNACGDASVKVKSFLEATVTLNEATAKMEGEVKVSCAAMAEKLYGVMGAGKEASGGSAGNTIAGIAMLGGKTANQKLIDDVKNYLASNNINPDKVTVKVTKADDPETDFSLDDPANDLELFQVRVDVPYSDVSYTPVSDANDYSLTAALTFRNGRAVTVD